MSPEQLQAIAKQVPDMAVAAMLTVFITDAVLAWMPRKIGPWTVPTIDGGRVVVLVFFAALVTVALMTDHFAFNRAFVLAALAVTVAAVTGNMVHDKLNDQREAQDRAALLDTLKQSGQPPK